jgi:hypothetical protein
MGEVSDIRINHEWVVSWVLRWRRRLFVWEEELLAEMLESLPRLVLSDADDGWWWVPGDGGRFSVHSVYILLGTVAAPFVEFSSHELRVFKNMWNCPAPSKVLAFSWKLFRNRIPTKSNLVFRGVQVTGGGAGCVHCRNREEDTRHLFLFCDFASSVWNAIFRWLGVIIVLPSDLFVLFDYFTGSAPNRKVGKGFSLIWHTTVWMIWKSRNEISFANGVRDAGKVIEDIKRLSWRWGLSRRKFPICLFYEWCWDPGLCLRR